MNYFIFYFIAFFIQNTAFGLDPKTKNPNEIYEKLGEKIDLNLSFKDQNNHLKTLKDMIGKNDVLILSLNYYRCTTMCTYQFLNMAEVFRLVKPAIGNGYNVATISIDPTDSPSLAKRTREIWLDKLGKPDAPWNFYVGEENSIVALANNLNFFYERDDEGNYSHAAALFFISKEGVFRRYLYGIVYDRGDVVQALYDTSQGRVGSFVPWFKSVFKKYDSTLGKYHSFFH